ncbi:MAG: PP2C family protein-serine/threonine phosphatase [Bacteroides cellulosilyticus]
MIPKIFPPYPEREDVDLHAILHPAKEVGGDLYDFFIDNDRLYFVIGDVSGKGIPASLFMAIARSLFRTLAQQATSPAEIMSKMNRSISENNRGQHVRYPHHRHTRPENRKPAFL